MRREVVMQGESPGVRAVIAALFAAEPITEDAVRRLHRGEIGDWLTALELSGLFAPAEAAALGQRWTADPRTLLHILLTEADDITRHRWLTLWDTLESADRRIS
ncbi:hypothetical protein [Nocardia terpenica]|nr:hypothetical protein [Nocardia terpenica]